MGMFSKIFKRSNVNGNGGISTFDFDNGIKSKIADMNLSAVYRCVRVISDSVAMLPIELYAKDKDGFIETINNDLSNILSSFPNERMTRYTLLQLWAQQLLLQGNAYGKIIRAGANVIAIEYVPSGDVTVNETPLGIVYNIKGRNYDSSEIIHILNNTSDGIRGRSVISYASDTLNLASYSTTQATNFFKSGAAVKGILISKGTLSPKQKKEIKETWRSENGGYDVTGGVVVLGADMDYKPITVTPSDAQLLESRAFDVVEICRFFGVSPTKAFDLSKSSYNTFEAGQLAFLNETLAPLLNKIELELRRKIFLPSEQSKYDIRFNINAILRADMASSASFYSQMLNCSSMTPNDIRFELGLPKIKGGDVALVQVNLTSLDALIKKSEMEAQGINVIKK